MVVRPLIPPSDVDELEEIWEWIESFDAVVEKGKPGQASRILQEIRDRALASGVQVPFTANTPYVNTIHVSQQAALPGDQEIERKIKSLVRWNALAMVVRANREEHNIGGHISTYGSVATLFEVGFDHFFRARTAEYEGDTVYFQGHAAPSVSMGLSPIMAIYQARFNRYLEDRGLKPKTDAKVWAFLGDGETDEPETLGAITLASREHLDNLIFVINCNLQRLDGPVRGNGSIVQELEAAFRGAGWNVIKVLWGSDWDPLFEKDVDGLLAKRLGEMVDGEYQKLIVESGAYIREHVFGGDPRLLKMVEDIPDEKLHALRQGGHDPKKVYAAYKAAVDHRGTPTVILARTIKGYGLGEAGEGRNVTHQQKKVDEDTLRHFGERFGLSFTEEQFAEVPFYRPPDDSPEMQYLSACRKKLGGYMPRRSVRSKPLVGNRAELFEEFLTGSEGREVSTTMAFVGMLRKMLRDAELGKLVVPIVPDEARTFGMESLFRLVGIYSSQGQLYEPVDMNTLLYYKEAKDGQILEEGITEAGSMSSFIAAGSAYATHGINTIPFFIFYSMFGLQRVADLIWAAADTRCRGFLLGGTAGRTTLAGEGLQHQDGNSHVLALPIPTLQAYDPAFAYEIAVIIEDGIDRMYHKGESLFYYITVMNEPYAMPAMRPGSREGILKGMYLYKAASEGKSKLRAQLFGSGSILREVLRAQEILAEKYHVAAAVWSGTGYKALDSGGIA